MSRRATAFIRINAVLPFHWQGIDDDVTVLLYELQSSIEIFNVQAVSTSSADIPHESQNVSFDNHGHFRQ